MRITLLVVTSIIGLAAAPASARQQTGAHHLDARGKTVMGFDQQKTAHHFLLFEDGGAIDVSVKDRTNATDLAAIRSHLPHIVHLFSQGDFQSPMLVHDSMEVPGTKDLARLKDKVKYAYVETSAGGRVDIVTTDKDAIAAVHTFLKYQIADHQTGDRLTPVKRR